MKTASRLFIAAILAAGLACAASASVAQAATVAPPVFADEFTAAPLSAAVWGVTTPWNTQYTNDELEYYDPADLTFTDGGLRITTEKRAAGDYGYTSGIITSGARTDLGGTSRKAFTYGYFEMRARLPKGQGIWPAFWLTNDHGAEIDVFELLGNDPRTVHMTLHHVVGGVKTQESAQFTGPDFSAGYHTFAVDWQPSYVRFYVDGVRRAEYTDTIPSDPLWIVANTAVGGVGSWPGAPDATTVLPQHYDIDYVRVYRTMADAAAPTRVKRMSGPDRYVTATAISAQTFHSADAVVIATGRDYADALAAAPLAGALKAPVLLVPGSYLPSVVHDEIARLGATKAVVVGASTVVGDGVAGSLKTMGLTVERVAGPNRFATAAAVVKRTLDASGTTHADTVFITRGDGFADALSVSSVAAGKRFPILLALPGTVPAETMAALRVLKPDHIVIVGGTGAISSGDAAALGSVCPDVQRVYGSTRYSTSAALAAYAIRKGWAGTGVVGLATGANFPDALGGGPAAGSGGGLLLLTTSATLSPEAQAFIQPREADVDTFSLYGGTTVISSQIETSLKSICGE